MAVFDDAIGTILEHEGGYVNNPSDPGGATNFGVSLRFLIERGFVDKDHDGFNDFDIDHDGDVDAQDVKKMSREQACEAYKSDFWRFDQIESQAIATKVFDLCVNCGMRPGVRILQKAVVACGQNIEPDGKLGPVTIAAANSVSPDELLPKIRIEAENHYRNLVKAKPRLSVFLDGWLKRAKA